ncbi:hypothetical protein E3N88_29813 [Mikania micrantha]|uniref:Uncharacterized protein n=1 Tax=Mikania micrantha TaxID=192012 RepID=A0A5N6MK17_9ASTR|nr:hypothetical protein E3N88_29813 [Mikania micrantha]
MSVSEIAKRGSDFKIHRVKYNINMRSNILNSSGLEIITIGKSSKNRERRRKPCTKRSLYAPGIAKRRKAKISEIPTPRGTPRANLRGGAMLLGSAESANWIRSLLITWIAPRNISASPVRCSTLRTPSD